MYIHFWKACHLESFVFMSIKRWPLKICETIAVWVRQSAAGLFPGTSSTVNSSSPCFMTRFHCQAMCSLRWLVLIAPTYFEWLLTWFCEHLFVRKLFFLFFSPSPEGNAGEYYLQDCAKLPYSVFILWGNDSNKPPPSPLSS